MTPSAREASSTQRGRTTILLLFLVGAVLPFIEVVIICHLLDKGAPTCLLAFGLSSIVGRHPLVVWAACSVIYASALGLTALLWRRKWLLGLTSAVILLSAWLMAAREAWSFTLD